VHAAEKSKFQLYEDRMANINAPYLDPFVWHISGVWRFFVLAGKITA